MEDGWAEGFVGAETREIWPGDWAGVSGTMLSEGVGGCQGKEVGDLLGSVEMGPPIFRRQPWCDCVGQCGA